MAAATSGNGLSPLCQHVVEVDFDAPWYSEAEGELASVPRQAVVLIPKYPLVAWLCSLKDSEGSSFLDGISLDMARSDLTAYLIPSDEEQAASDAQEFVDHHYRRFFAQELSQWISDRAQWPELRTLSLFHQWYEVRVYSIVMDTVQ